jgi:hypothetical protein
VLDLTAAVGVTGAGAPGKLEAGKTPENVQNPGRQLLAVLSAFCLGTIQPIA